MCKLHNKMSSIRLTSIHQFIQTFNKKIPLVTRAATWWEIAVISSYFVMYVKQVLRLSIVWPGKWANTALVFALFLIPLVTWTLCLIRGLYWEMITHQQIVLFWLTTWLQIECSKVHVHGFLRHTPHKVVSLFLLVRSPSVARVVVYYTVVPLVESSPTPWLYETVWTASQSLPNLYTYLLHA